MFEAIKKLFKREHKPFQPTHFERPSALPYDKHKSVFLVVYNDEGIPCPFCLPMFKAFSVVDDKIPVRDKMRLVFNESADPQLAMADRMMRKTGGKMGLPGLSFPTVVANGNAFVGTNTFDYNRGLLDQIVLER